MTVANNYAVLKYEGNGSTTNFSFTWPVYQSDDVVVYQNVAGVETVVPDTDYSVSLTDSGGVVSFNTAPAVGTIIALTRSTPLSQETPYKTSSGFDAVVVEHDFDKQVMSLQEISKELEFCVKTNVTSDVDPDVLAAEVQRVYGSIDNVDAVADDISSVNAVAADLTNIDAVASDLTNIDAVAADLTNIDAVAADLTNIDAVVADLTNIDAVAADLTNIDAVASDLTNIDAVASDLTNIDAVAADLANIDAASTYANNANVWAEGTDEQVAVLGGEHSAEEWAKIASISAGISRNIGEIVYSTIPLTDSALHLLDGSLISGSGIYSDFVDYIADLYDGGTASNCFCSEADWQSSVTSYGVCGKFVYDDVNNTVRLPKITGFVEAAADATSLGNLTEAGLPNITGSFSATDIQGAQHDYTGTGCFENNANGSAPYAGGGGNPNTYRLIDIDASRSSDVYGNSNTVQPQAIKVLYYIVMATTTKTDIQVDIDEIATDLNGKVDIDLSNAVPTLVFAALLNTAGIRTVIETYTSGTSWYRIWSDGWCEQGGVLDKGSASISTENIILLKPYKDTDYNVVLTLAIASSGSAYTPLLIVPLSTTQFSCGMTGTQWRYMYWRACGYITLGENS